MLCCNFIQQSQNLGFAQVQILSAVVGICDAEKPAVSESFHRVIHDRVSNVPKKGNLIKKLTINKPV